MWVGKMVADNTYFRMKKVSRPVHGPRSIASVVPIVTGKAFGRGSASVGQFVEAWVAIMGPVLAEVTFPKKYIQGTLTIGCSGPVAMELQHLSGELMSRINLALGSEMVRRLQFIQS